jgi:NAD(P)H-dependent flavin oxidoreductase YrpB (nitropropane dioxygenase family)
MVSWGEDLPDAGCGVNFLVPFVTSAGDVTSAARGACAVEFFFGPPDAELVAAGHRVAPVVGWQAGSVDEARAAVDAGCDYVVVQGVEAGGHVRGDEGLNPLLLKVLAELQVPIVAAGGIATAERVAELIGAGADGVRVGTRFLACPEARAHAEYLSNLLAASGDDTVLTDWFDEEWPDARHRVLRSSVEAARESGWRSVLPPTRDVDRPARDMAQYAGTGVSAVTSVQPAADVLADLVRLL